MEIKDIYEKLDKIGCLSFSTLKDDGYVESRIAHFFAYDQDGIYLRSMYVKPFYKEMKETGKISACGMYPTTYVTHDGNHLPGFKPGYTMRITGDIRELTMEEVEAKAKGSELFNVAVYDIKKYPATRVFVLYRARGECYDYDYRMENRDHKLERERFAFGGMECDQPGFKITKDCIGCGACKEICTFKAVREGNPYGIMGNRCDECGSCVEVCPKNAIVYEK